MKKLIVTVGLPRSGKSGWSIKYGAPVVEPDAIRLALYGGPRIKEGDPKVVYDTAFLMVSTLFITGHDTVILCATNTNRTAREFWRNSEWTREFHIFATSPEECVRRAIATEQDYLLPIIERMTDGFEKITRDELGPGEKALARCGAFSSAVKFEESKNVS